MTSIQKTLDQMLKRSLALHGSTFNEKGEPMGLNEAVQGFMKALATDTPDPKEQLEMIKAAWDKGDASPEMLALNALRVEEVANFIAVESTFMSMYFETVTLKPDEEPYIINDTEQEIRASYISEDGEPEEVRVIKVGSRIAIALRLIASEKVKYKMTDLYKGDISGIVQKTFNISRDLTFKVDREHFNLVNASLANGGCFGPFSYENDRTKKEMRVYLPHSGIITSHLPQTNYWDLTQTAGHSGTQDGKTVVDNPTADQTTKFCIEVLKAIQQYATNWGNVLPGGGRLAPTGEIIVPSSDIIAIADDATPESGTQENKIQEGINTNGYASLHYLGQNWKFIPDVTIASGTCFPRFNLLPGTTFSKPNFDAEFVETNKSENWERRWQRKCFGAHIKSQFRPRALKIKYKS